MSYILDALRRAEAERGRGAVPGLHSQTTPAPGSAPAAGRPVAVPVWMAGVVAGVAVVAATGAWWVMQRSTPHSKEIVAATSSGSPAPSAAALPSRPSASASMPSLSAGAQVVPSSASPAPLVVVPMVPSAQPVAPTLPVKRAVPPPRDKERQAPDAAAKPSSSAPRPRANEAIRVPEREAAEVVPRAPKSAAVTAVVASPAASESASGPIFSPADLPDVVRAQLPVLKISGITYSRNSVSRMAIVNGQVLHEGDPAAPGLLLERIEPGRTVWSFRGYRYGLAP